MERVTKRSTGRLSRLFNVLVAGGIALATGCATTQGGSKPDKPDDGSASSQPSSPGGVRGW